MHFIETHKFQLGPHIAENVVPSLTVTDTLLCSTITYTS